MNDHEHGTPWTRRQALAGTAALSAATLAGPHALANVKRARAAGRRGRLKQSVARWCYSSIGLGDLCAAVAGLGMPAIDLLLADEWQVALDHGLVVSVGDVGAGTIRKGLNDRGNHETIVAAFREHIPAAARARVANVICFFGDRIASMPDATAIRNSVDCLSRCKGIAEDHGVTIVVEMLNSKVDHPGYIGDTTRWGVEIVAAVDSPRVKLLYDIYHMQIMEGDVIRTIRNHHEHIAHYHTGGVPGRHEIDTTQELYYPAIAAAILDTGFAGYFAHEFIPLAEAASGKIDALHAAVELCDV